MELDLTSIGADDIQVQEEVKKEQPSTNTTKPNQQRSFNKEEDLWNNPNAVPTKKLEFLKYKIQDKSYSLFYNERTDNLPEKYLNMMIKIVKALPDWELRLCWKKSDIATKLVSEVSDQTKIKWYFPVKKYNEDAKSENIVSFGRNKEAFSYIKGFHKSYDKIPGFIRALCANSLEVMLDKDLDSSLSCVIIYTPCGLESITKEFDYGVNGHVGFIINLAKELKIPLFNIASPTFSERFVKFVKEGKYITATAYKISKGENDHTEGSVVKEQVRTTTDTTSNEIKVEEDNTEELFN